MKILRKLLKIASILFLVMVLLATGLVFYVVKNPKETWQIIESRFLPEDLKITWQDLSFQISREGGRLWKTDIEFSNLCLQKKDPLIDVCLDHLQTDGLISLKELLHPELTISFFEAKSKYVNIFKPSEKVPDDEEPEKNFFEIAHFWQSRIALWTSFVKIQKVDLHISHFELRSQESPPLIFSFDTSSESFYEAANFHFDLQQTSKLSLKTKGELFLSSWTQGHGSVAQIRSHLDMNSLQVEIPNLILAWKDKEHLVSNFQAQLQLSKKRRSKIETKLELSAKVLQIQGKGSVAGLGKPVDSLSPIPFALTVPMESGTLWAGKNSSLEASAVVPVFFVEKKELPKMEKACACDLPDEIGVEVKSEFSPRNYFSKKDGWLLQAQAQIQSLNNNLFSTENLVKVEIEREKGEFSIFPFVDSNLTLHRFQSLARLLRTLKITVPAPFSVLDGKAQFSMRGPLEKDKERWKVPFISSVNLGSERQRVDVTAGGYFDALLKEKTVSTHLSVLIQNLTLQLPPLDPIYGLPKVSKDPRFEISKPQAKVKKRKSAFQFRFFVQVRTQEPGRIRLLTSLAKPYIPLDLQLNYQSGRPIQGQVSLSQFEVEYLKRTSTVEKLDLKLNEPKGTFPLNGRFRFDQNPYKIFIEVLGTAKEPQIVLRSEPYLDRSDIISVLLYGRTNDRLVAADSKTVGSFNAALADRAIGILGIWAFASTPIQSFSYNQLNQQYTAQLKVTDDTSLAVGTNWEEATSLELQKRLSEKWMISAALEPTEDEEQTEKLRLQWEDRF